MVIIILDEDIIEKHDIAIIRSALSLNIKNLGIFIASKINNPFQFNLNPVYIGDNLIEKFEVK